MVHDCLVCIPDSHTHRVTNTKCRIDTVLCSDDGLIKVNQFHYRPEVPRGFQEVKVPRIRDNGPGWW